MIFDPPDMALIAIFTVLTALRLVRAFSHRGFLFDTYLSYTGLFFLTFVASRLFSFEIAIWMMAILSFWAIREYFSLAEIRLQDRLALLGAYLSIPFMYYFIQIDWYGMFVLSIPLYAFLAVPLFVALGGRETEGTVFSIGTIDFGLFLFVFCIGHVGYLLSFSVWMAALLVINVLVCDLAACLMLRRAVAPRKAAALCYLVAAPVTLGVSLALSRWTTIPPGHSTVLALMTPALVLMGRQVGGYVEADLGVERDMLTPGRGRNLDSLQSLCYAAPVMFHYIRFFLK